MNATTTIAAVVTAFAADDWLPDWDIIVGLFGWALVAAAAGYKLFVWLRHGDDF
jgi:hypothetical protein